MKWLNEEKHLPCKQPEYGSLDTWRIELIPQSSLAATCVVCLAYPNRISKERKTGREGGRTSLEQAWQSQFVFPSHMQKNAYNSSGWETKASLRLTWKLVLPYWLVPGWMKDFSQKYKVKSGRRQTASISDLHMHFYHIPPTQVF